MELKIFDRSLNLIGVIDSFSTLIWNRKYNDLGIFQMNILFTNEVNSILNIDNIIYKDNGESGFIVSKEIKINEDGTETIEVKGNFIIGYLERRIIWGCEEINSNVVDASYRLINNNCIECASERIIPNLALDDKPDINISLIKQVSYDNLLDTLILIAQNNELGIKVDFDIINKKLKFKIYKGIDRSINQNIVAPIIFSREFENVLEQNYFQSNSNYKNVGLVGGAGEGAERKLESIGNEESGLDRHELFIDARDIQDTRDIEVDGVNKKEVIPDPEYKQLLITRGKEKLLDCYKVKTFDTSINKDANIKYIQDYDLGDIVTFFDKKWGVTIDTRITGITETYSENGISLEITFGNNIPTLMQIIKKKG